MLKLPSYFILFTFLICKIAIGSTLPISYVTNFNSPQYLGIWYEIAHLPFIFERNCIAPITAHYDINPKNPTEILATNTCALKHGGFAVANGAAHFDISPTIGKLKVTFVPSYLRWLHIGYGTYWILATDYTHYALVGNPNHRYLWILSRSETMSPELLNNLISLAKSQGFNVNQLIFTTTHPLAMQTNDARQSSSDHAL